MLRGLWSIAGLGPSIDNPDNWQLLLTTLTPSQLFNLNLGSTTYQISKFSLFGVRSLCRNTVTPSSPYTIVSRFYFYIFRSQAYLASMVRIKHRYLLVNILYPEPSKSQSTSQQPLEIPDLVSIHQPTSDDLTPQLLAKAIRDQILLMYGDYGSGVTSTGLLGP